MPLSPIRSKASLIGACNDGPTKIGSDNPTVPRVSRCVAYLNESLSNQNSILFLIDSQKC
jgi:hypothetical protein